MDEPMFKRKKVSTDEDDENTVRKSSEDPFKSAKEVGIPVQQDLRLTCSAEELLRIACYQLIYV